MQLKNSKKMYILILIIILTCSIFINIVQALTEAAPDPGSDGDPIVSKSYVDASVASINTQLQQYQLLQEKYNQLLLNMDALKKQIDTKSTKSYEFVPIDPGQKLFAGLGTEIILVSGKANSIKGSNGGLIDTNTAKQLLTVSPILLNHLLVSATNDGRGLYTVGKCYVLIKGIYSLDTKPSDIPVEVPQATVAPQTTPPPKITPEKTPIPREIFVGTGSINATVLNLREKADITSKIVTKLSKGQTVSIITFTEEWYKIKTADGLYGWVLGQYVDLKN